ncbi:MAG TPA: PP2C family protein-serine/threonine phosphatase [Tepidisphaeraceae bacterium]|nr:PP2C family protein-serine/threonine phosphatase [Tepidisphaeraceae bacterium]
MNEIVPTHLLLNSDSPYDDRMSFIVDTMREMSRISDPQELVRVYGARMRQVMQIDGMVSLSRRGLQPPHYRITRSSRWEKAVNPWTEKNRLPLLDSGLLGELIYGDQPVIIDELEVAPDDPAADYLAGMKSIMAIPLYEHGTAVNMAVLMRNVPFGFPRERLPVHVWMGNLFGRATQTLVLSGEVTRAYDAVERELKAVADIQRSLLPAELPAIPNLELAVHYQTSRHSGGDYYDFFKLPDDRWGILMADVSGHGTPAAVLMAITHTIAHIASDPPVSPAQMLGAINARLARTYTSGSGSFVTAFYGIFDSSSRTLLWSNAGHPPPRGRRADGSLGSLPLAQNLPLGIEGREDFVEQSTQLLPGDLILFYTDGITEARGPNGDMFDIERLDAVLGAGAESAADAIDKTLAAVNAFTDNRPLTDDRTLLAAMVK